MEEKKFFFQNENGKNFLKYLEIRKQNYSSSKGNSQFRNISKDLYIKAIFSSSNLECFKKTVWILSKLAPATRKHICSNEAAFMTTGFHKTVIKVSKERDKFWNQKPFQIQKYIHHHKFFLKND